MNSMRIGAWSATLLGAILAASAPAQSSPTHIPQAATSAHAAAVEPGWTARWIQARWRTERVPRDSEKSGLFDWGLEAQPGFGR
jgi:hypothetical protein